VSQPRRVISPNYWPVLFAASAFLFLFVCSSEAQSWRTRETVYPAQTVDGVPLQPFTFDRQPARAQAIQVAYYVPRPTWGVESIRRDGYDSEATTPGFDVGGSHPWFRVIARCCGMELLTRPRTRPTASNMPIWAVNSIRNRPYAWGGDNGSFHDYGYDCSGTVSFALTMPACSSNRYRRAIFFVTANAAVDVGSPIYSRDGHVFAMIAGLRLDTSRSCATAAMSVRVLARRWPRRPGVFKRGTRSVVNVRVRSQHNGNLKLPFSFFLALRYLNRNAHFSPSLL